MTNQKSIRKMKKLQQKETRTRNMLRIQKQNRSRKKSLKQLGLRDQQRLRYHEDKITRMEHDLELEKEEELLNFYIDLDYD